MTCTRLDANTIICDFINGFYRIKVGRRVFYFEWHHYLGPQKVDRSGESLDNPIDENDLFWVAIDRFQEMDKLERSKIEWSPYHKRYVHELQN